MFELKDINKASPVFNRAKLLWFNQKYIQALSPDALTNKFNAWMGQQSGLEEFKQSVLTKGPDFLQKALLLEQSRSRTLSEIPAAIGFFYHHQGNSDLLASKQTKKLSPELIKKFFSDTVILLGTKSPELSDLSHEQWEGFVREQAAIGSVPAGSLFMSIRMAVTDSQFSPPLLEVMQILERDEVNKRINKYL